MMPETVRAPVSKLTEDFSGRIPERLIQELPDNYVEYLIIDQRKRALLERAPGKYDELLDTLHILSNFNPISKLNLTPTVGVGLCPAAEPAYHWGRWNNDVADNKTPLPLPFRDYPELVAHQKEMLNSSIDTEDVPKALTIDFLPQVSHFKYQLMDNSYASC